MVKTSCQCGAVVIEVAAAPSKVTDCNCSICRRLGALWAYYLADEVDIHSAADATLAYVWGDRMLAFHTCRTCGCTTHWSGLYANPRGRMAINARLLEPGELAKLTVRKFDGAETWTFLDAS